MAITDLTELLRCMQPELWPGRYGFACVDPTLALPGGVVPFAMVAEAEGLTLVAHEAELQAAGLAFQGGWARISLTVVSDLAAVGLTAAVAGALAAVGISANVVAGYHYDHFFVQADRAEDALVALRDLGRPRVGGVARD